MTALPYTGLSRSPSFTSFYYGCPVNPSAYKLPIGAIFDVVSAPATFAAVGTRAKTWHKTRFKVIETEVRKVKCRMLEEVASRELTPEEIEHHQKLLEADK